MLRLVMLCVCVFMWVKFISVFVLYKRAFWHAMYSEWRNNIWFTCGELYFGGFSLCIPNDGSHDSFVGLSRQHVMEHCCWFRSDRVMCGLRALQFHLICRDILPGRWSPRKDNVSVCGSQHNICSCTWFCTITHKEDLVELINNVYFQQWHMTRKHGYSPTKQWTS